MDSAPRKPAKQARSRATIDVILEATGRVVAQVGLDRATTNQIAQLAGVSIGSLYQYFPGKRALLAALIEREAQADMAALRDVVDSCAELGLVPSIERLGAAMVARHARNPALYRWMLTYVPELGMHPKVRAIAAQGRALLRDLLVTHRAVLSPQVEPALAALVLGPAVEAALHNVTFERPETLDDGTLVREIVALCRGYLLHREPAAP